MSEAPPNRRSPAPGWQEVLDAPIFLAATAETADEEIRLNTWTLSASRRQRAGTAVEELAAWIERLVADRRAKLRAQPRRRATLYLWLDEVSGTLSVGLVSEVHERLPFAGRVNLLASPEPILRAFLGSAAAGGAGPRPLPEVDLDAPLPPDADVPVQDVYAVEL